MTDGEKYIALTNCYYEYRDKMPKDVESINVVQTGRDDYPEIIEIHWKSGGKSGIGNKRVVDLLKPHIDNVEEFCTMAIDLLGKEKDALQPAAEKEAYDTRPWTYVLGVLDDDGKRVERYSWYESNSWELCGQTDEKTLQQEIDSCRRFRAESTSRWHVYKRMRGQKELQLVF